jgi:hypothetical protein
MRPYTHGRELVLALQPSSRRRIVGGPQYGATITSALPAINSDT